jgi:hypothetical protein
LEEFPWRAASFGAEGIGIHRSAPLIPLGRHKFCNEKVKPSLL